LRVSEIVIAEDVDWLHAFFSFFVVGLGCCYRLVSSQKVNALRARKGESVGLTDARPRSRRMAGIGR
jgi:hypothetical protein